MFDHSSDPNFLDYYADASLSAETLLRFRTVRDKALALLARQGSRTDSLRVADVGCGAGTNSQLWAELGHQVHGIDVNAPLIELARSRAAARNLAIRFDVGSATALPYADKSMDVVLLPELLEHVPDWEGCLREASRILFPGGLLYLSTTNALCPKQEEFDLPAYSWYPKFIKRRYEQLAVTSRPELVSFAKYPAVHWFTFFGLRDYLRDLGLRSFDRFDLMEESTPRSARRFALQLVRKVPPARLLGHMLTPWTTIFAIKDQLH